MARIHITKSFLMGELGEAKQKQEALSFPYAMLYKSDRATLQKLGFVDNAELQALTAPVDQLATIEQGIAGSALRSAWTAREVAYIDSLSDADDEDDLDEEDEDEADDSPEPLAQAPIELPAAQPTVSPGHTPASVVLPAQTTVQAPATLSTDRVSQAEQKLYLMVKRTRMGTIQQTMQLATERGVTADALNFGRALLEKLAERFETDPIIQLTANGSTQEMDTFEAVNFLMSLIPGKVPTQRVADQGQIHLAQTPDGTPPDPTTDEGKAYRATIRRLVNGTV